MAWAPSVSALTFVEDPITTLMAGKATDNTIYDILRIPLGGARNDWYRNLNHDQAAAVLDLLATIQVGTWQAENRITGIATPYPRLVLDRTTEIRSLRRLLRNAGDHNLTVMHLSRNVAMNSRDIKECKPARQRRSPSRRQVMQLAPLPAMNR